MEEKKSLVKNTIIIAIGKLSTQVISFLLLPLYTAKLSTEEYGTYDYITTIGIFLLPVITLLMEESMFRFLIDAKNKEGKEKVITQTIIYILISTIIFSICAFIILKIINYQYIYMLILYIISCIIIGVSNALSRGLSKIKIYSISNLIAGIITVILNILTIVYLKMGVNGLLISTIIANMIVSIFVFKKLNILKYISINKLDKNLLAKMIKFSIPLIPNSIAMSIINISDRIIVTNILGAGQNGIYSIAYKFPNIISAFYGYFGIAWKESASKMVNSNQQQEYYKDVYYQTNKMLFAICICILAVMPIAFPIFINSQYQDAYMHIPILILSVYFCNIAMFIGGIYIAYKDTKTIGTTTIMAAIINVAVDLLLINSIGLFAASISTLIANIFLCEYRRYRVSKYVVLKNRIDISNILIFILVLIAYFINNIILSVIVFIFAIIYAYIKNKTEIKLLFTKIILRNKNIGEQ